jgi:hypothetical protein
MKRAVETHTITWRDRVVRIRYEACWLGTTGPFSRAHLEVRLVSPKGEILPITETGYRSHFAEAAVIDEAGGPVAFVRAWLDRAAQFPDWKEREVASRQMTLF